MGNVNMEAYQVHFEGKSVAEKLKELDETVKENEQEIDSLSDIVSIKADRIDIAPIFSEESAYSAGDLVYNSNSLWKFSVDHATGDWDPSEVSAVNIDMELSELKNTLSNPFIIKSTSGYIGQEAQAITFSSDEESSTVTLNKDSLVLAIATGKGLHYAYFGYPTANNILVYPQTDSTSINMILLKAGTQIKATARYGISDRASEVYIRVIPIEELYSPYS